MFYAKKPWNLIDQDSDYRASVNTFSSSTTHRNIQKQIIIQYKPIYPSLLLLCGVFNAHQIRTQEAVGVHQWSSVNIFVLSCSLECVNNITAKVYS